MSVFGVIRRRIFRPVGRVLLGLCCCVYENTMGCQCTKERMDIEGRRFFIIRRLGQGGFSNVDLAEDTAEDKKYALKRIQCHSTKEEKAAEEEAKFHLLFNHPNIIPLEAWGKRKSGADVSEVILVLPYFKRGTLQDELDRLKDRGDYLSEIRLWHIFKGICDGVQALHLSQPSIAHRDLKPGNVMLSQDDTPVLMDFGSMVKGKTEIKGRSDAIALQDDAAEKCSMLFRAPELFHVESHCIVDEKVDIWSLGCVLFNLAFLYSPFEPIYQKGDSLHLAVLGKNYKFPDNSRYSPALKELVTSMLVVEAAERPNINWVQDRISRIEREQDNRV